MIKAGEILDKRYLVKNCLGSGSYGLVLLATDLRNKNRQVAVKMIQKKGKEIEILKSLPDVDGISKLLHSGSLESHNYLVMDVFNEDLSQLRKRNPNIIKQPSTILQVLWHTINTLEKIHYHGIVHRDVKMSNLMLKKSNGITELVLIDFGIAARFRDQYTGQRISIPLKHDFFWGCNYSPPRVANGYEYLESEELIAASYTAIFMLFDFLDCPWFATNVDEMQVKKVAFGQSPEIFLTKENDQYLVPIIKIINEQEYGKLPDYESIKAVIKKVMEEQQVTTEMNI